jgi:hypothetical protein
MGMISQVARFSDILNVSEVWCYLVFWQIICKLTFLEAALENRGFI